jgi:hypothetical protein
MSKKSDIKKAKQLKLILESYIKDLDIMIENGIGAIMEEGGDEEDYLDAELLLSDLYHEVDSFEFD